MQRPTPVTIFGILNIVFGLMAFCCLPFSVIGFFVPMPEGQENPVMDLINQSMFLKVWTIGGAAIGFLASMVLIAAGIGLLLMKNWGRILSVGYGVYSLVMSFIGLIINVVFIIMPLFSDLGGSNSPEEVGGAVGGAIGGTCGACVGLIYPLVLIYFMTRPTIIQALNPVEGQYGRE